MRNRIVASFTLLSLMCPMALPALALGGPSEVESVQGQVLTRDGSRGWKSLDANSLAVGDAIRTGEDGQAILRLGDNRIRVAANSEVRIVSVDPQSSEIHLERGKILSRVGTPVTVNTHKSSTRASKGEFVLETAVDGAALKVLSGNASLRSLKNQEVALGGVEQIPQTADQKALSSIANLGSDQTVGDVAMLGEWRTKGKGARVRDTNESVGGESDAAPDQDVTPPRRPEPPVVENPPQPPQPPQTPPSTPPQSPPSTPPAAGGGFPTWGVVGGLLLIGGVVALVAGNDDDDENVFVPSSPGVPSPSSP